MPTMCHSIEFVKDSISGAIYTSRQAHLSTRSHRYQVMTLEQKDLLSRTDVAYLNDGREAVSKDYYVSRPKRT